MIMRLTTTEIFGSFALAFIVSFLMTPVARWIAPKIGAMDIPKDNRRMHTKAMPRFGGMAIYLGAMTSIFVFLRGNEHLLALMIGGTLIYAMGVVDDLTDLDARIKFGFQTFVAVLMYFMGLRIEFITNYFGGGGHWQFGTAVGFVVTVLWIVGITNTINLIDGLDGLAAGVAAIAALSIAYVAYIHGDRYGMMVVCVGMMAIAGSSLGFLPFNFYPAKLFMGDSGSLFLGFMIAIFAVISPLKRSTLLAVIVPVLVLGIPIFDTAFAIVRRLILRKPIMSPDKEHLHHHLMRLGYGQRRAVLMIYGICAIMGMAAIIMSRDLYLESVVLLLTALLYIYVFLTDQNHKMPTIQAPEVKSAEKKEIENKETEEDKEEKSDK